MRDMHSMGVCSTLTQPWILKYGYIEGGPEPLLLLHCYIYIFNTGDMLVFLSLSLFWDLSLMLSYSVAIT